MEQQILRRSPPKAKLSRRAIGFLSVFFALGVCTAALVAYLIIRESSQSMVQHLENNLSAQAQQKVADTTVWYGTLKKNVEQLAATDMFRLFITEMRQLRDHLPGLKKQAAPTGSHPLAGEAANLSAQVPLLVKQLQRFARATGVLAIRVLDEKGNTYLSTESTPPALLLEQEEAVRRVLDSGNPALLPTRSSPQGLIMDMVHPVYPPAYVEMPGNKPVAAMLLRIPVTQVLQAMLSENTRLLQLSEENTLQELVPASNEVRPLPDWHAHEDGGLPLEKRTLADGAQVYALGFAVPSMPWFVTQEEPAHIAEASFTRIRNTVLLLACYAVGILALLLGGLWWWLLGRNERSFNQEVTALYHAASAQKQILDGINSALADGIVLADTEHRILYANQAAAHMTEHKLSEMPGLLASEVFCFTSPHHLVERLEKTIAVGDALEFTAVLWVQGKQRHYQIVCSPYRDESGHITGTVSVYRDISALVTAQEASQRMVRQTISVLMRAIEAADPYLCGQSAQTGALASMLAKEMHLAQSDQDTVRTAAALSQIGMLRLPAELLRKKSPLTPEERNRLEQHVEFTMTMLADFDFGLPVQKAISQMHECLDGSGYPAHLHGEQICLHARLLAVSNAFCAMVRPRSYRQALSVAEALEVLSVTPPRYDPGIVMLLRELLGTEAGKKFVAELCEPEASSLPGHENQY